MKETKKKYKEDAVTFFDRILDRNGLCDVFGDKCWWLDGGSHYWIDREDCAMTGDLSVGQKINILVGKLDGAVNTNKALAEARDGDEMVDILLGASQKLGLGLTRSDLINTPPIRDWIWWKNKNPTNII
eukprot:g43414.t1